MSKVLKEVNEYLGVKKINTTPYHPQTDSLVKQFNRTLEGLLAKVTSECQDDWDIYMPPVLFVYCTSVHKVTQDSLFFLLYRCKANFPMDVSVGVPVDAIRTTMQQYQSELVMRLQQAQALVVEAQQHMQSVNQWSYDWG